MKRFLFLILASVLLAGPTLSLAAPHVKTNAQSDTITRRVSTLADLKLVDITRSAIPAVQLMGRSTEGDGGEGVFRKLLGDQSANAMVLADTLEGVFVKPTTPGDGSTGVWMRINPLPVNPVWYGATPNNDGDDDSPPIQEAFNFLVLNTGGTIYIPPGEYFGTDTVVPQYAGETPLERYNKVQALTPVDFIGNITVDAYGARLKSTTATMTPTFPFSMMAFVEVERVTLKGLEFESDLNNKATGWFDSTNYFNTSVPAVSGEFACFFVGFRDIRIQDCIAVHCEGGFILTDDRNFSSIVAGEPMNSYRSIITGCRIFNCWQGLSMTYGATEEMIIENNHFEYTFIKLVQESDQGRAVHIKNNTGRDVSGILLNTNDSQITGNTFNNLLGGFSLQPQGGSDPSTDFDYDLRKMTISDNVCYSDHTTDVTSGTAQPQGFVRISATSVSTAGQTVTVDDLNINNNQVSLWPVGGTSTGSFLSRGGDADLEIEDVSVVGNTVMLNNNVGVVVALAANGLDSNTTFTGKIDFSKNSITRITGNANFEFQFWSGTFDTESHLIFNDNIIDVKNTNRTVTMGRIGSFVSKNNKFILADTAIATSAIYWIASVPVATIRDNVITRLAPTNNVGYLLYIDGHTTGVYDAVLDKAVYRVSGTRMSNGQFIFASAITFPASAQGFYELFGNVIRDNVAHNFQVYPAITGFTSENVVNPSKTSPPPSIDATPAWYIVWNADTTAAQPIGWKWDGTWHSIGTH